MLKTLAIPTQEHKNKKQPTPTKPTARDCKSQAKDHQPNHQSQSHKGKWHCKKPKQNEVPSARKSQPQKING
jgi:hypothetical protein